VFRQGLLEFGKPIPFFVALFPQNVGILECVDVPRGAVEQLFKKHKRAEKSALFALL